MTSIVGSGRTESDSVEGRPRNSSVSNNRPSADTQEGSSSASHDELLRGRGWGEAPAYEADGAGRAGQEEVRIGTPTTEEPVPRTRRPSRFTQFFSMGSHRSTPSSQLQSSSSTHLSASTAGVNTSATGQHRPQPSTVSSTNSSTLLTSNTRPTHRPSNSLSTLSHFGSSSVSLLLRPTGSRLSIDSDAGRTRLTSPSQLSISAPVQVAKTNWVHPEQGLTPQQMAFISYVPSSFALMSYSRCPFTSAYDPKIHT